MLPLSLGGRGPVLTLIAGAIMLSAGAADVRAQAEPGGNLRVGMSTAPMLVPAIVNGPATRGEAGHWTLRDSRPVVPVLAGEDAGARRPVRAHAEVAMFSWREILLAGIGVVLALGALLVFTGGNSPHRSRHS